MSITPGGNPTCPKCGRWYGIGLEHTCRPVGTVLTVQTVAEIERIVGASAHETEHLGRAVSAEGKLYVLHSRECLDSTPNLDDCEFSQAMGMGINPATFPEDDLVHLAIDEGFLIGVQP